MFAKAVALAANVNGNGSVKQAIDGGGSSARSRAQASEASLDHSLLCPHVLSLATTAVES
jgi:hypothetical protein